MFFQRQKPSHPQPRLSRRTFAAALIAIAVGATTPTCLRPIDECGEEGVVPPKCLPIVDAGIKEDAVFDADDADADAEADAMDTDAGN